MTEIYLCASCSCHEILRSATARVRLDEVADTASGRTYLRVSRVDPGSEAHRQLPQLTPGAYVHTVAQRAVGGMHSSAVVSLLKARPITIHFCFSAGEVDAAAEEQKRHGITYHLRVISLWTEILS